MIKPSPATEAYDPEAFWDAKAVRSAHDLRGAVGMEDPRRDRCIDRLQSELLGNALEWVDSRSKLDGSRVLDFGCGTGRWAFPLLARGVRYTGVDLSGQMLSLASSRFPDIPFLHTASGDGLPFSDGSFDLVLSVGVVHHNRYSEQERILAELRRVLSTGGHLILFEGLGDPPLSPDSVFHYRSAEGWRHLGQSSGFEPEWEECGNYWPCLDIAERLKRRFSFGNANRVSVASWRMLETMLLHVDERIGPSLTPMLPLRLHTRIVYVMSAK